MAANRRKNQDRKGKINREIEKGSGKKTSGRMESFWLDTVPGRQFDRLSEVR